MTSTKRQNHHGFTLAELLVALVVTSIVLAAVATLAFALGAANQTSSDTSQKQAQVRFVTLRISELIRHSKLICGTTGDDIVLWKADDNPENGIIDVFELAYIERGSSADYIRILEFSGCPAGFEESFRAIPNQVDAVGEIWLKDMLTSQCQERYIQVLPQCSNVQFVLVPSPPYSRFVSISFDLVENGIVNQYQINAGIRNWAENLLNETGDSLVSDDD
jgi:prepilin-type N-terminal cleavage/methylation domain-containing protein